MAPDGQRVTFDGIHLIVRDIASSAEFYRSLGMDVNTVGDFANVIAADGRTISLGTPRLTAGYDPGWRDTGSTSSVTVNVGLGSREAVDALYSATVAAGYSGHLPPVDAFWGSRFAIVLDPDGHFVGLHSPQDRSRATPPPA